ncbi:hypothetical protein BD770DRAFT_462796 [Pilaira anomala]|nr:hypothetical protein BD770DRAFT_462796 [Pilaira anomala]
MTAGAKLPFIPRFIYFMKSNLLRETAPLEKPKYCNWMLAGIQNTTLTLAQKQKANRLARANGKIQRINDSWNTAAIIPCPDCISKGCYNAEKLHSSRRSIICPGHIQNTSEYIEESVGTGYRRFVRKIGLKASIIFPTEKKDIFLRRIYELVDDYRVQLQASPNCLLLAMYDVAYQQRYLCSP